MLCYNNLNWDTRTVEQSQLYKYAICTLTPCTEFGVTYCSELHNAITIIEDVILYEAESFMVYNVRDFVSRNWAHE